MFVTCPQLWILRATNISVEKQCGIFGMAIISLEKSRLDLMGWPLRAMCALWEA